MSIEGNDPGNGTECLKQQGGVPLPFLDHDFKVHHTMEWLQWERIGKMLAKGATQLNTVNNIGTKFKALLIKLLAVHGKDNINMFAEMKQRLEVENFPKGAKE
eukprot:3841887-Ditylum_brightwellii.AAC.1